MRLSSTQRIQRMGITPHHRYVTWVMGFVFFFELGDIYSFSYVAPAIRSQWQLSISGIATIMSATFFGMFLGAIFGGLLSDAIGRKKALIISSLLYGFCSLATAFAAGPTSLLVARLMTGIGLSALTVAGMTYVSEVFPARNRGAYQGWILLIGMFGIPATAYVANACVPLVHWGWRIVFVWGALGILFPILATRLQESPIWYENHGRFEDAEAVVLKMERSSPEQSHSIPDGIALPEPASASTSPLDVFNRTNLFRTTVLIVAWIAQTLGLFGFMSWVPTLLSERGYSMANSLSLSAAISLGTIPGTFVGALVADRWQRKYWIVAIALTSAACGILHGLMSPGILVAVFGFLVSALQSMFAPIIYAYTAESFPPAVRNTGSGIAYGAGRLANIVGPLLIAMVYAGRGHMGVFCAIATCWVAVAITIGVFGPTRYDVAA